MNEDYVFVDHYNTLRVRPDCSAKALEQAYRHLAKLYHPDHPETADVGRFKEVIEAYKALRDPDERARYDALFFANENDAEPEPAANGDIPGGEKAALDDAEAHARILHLLYRKRRESAQDAGVPEFALLDALGCPDEHLEFHLWYLRAKGFLERTETGMYAITIAGVDHVIATSQSTARERLLIAQSDHLYDEAPPQPGRSRDSAA
jgi:curved DNA-binding protein